MRLKDKVDKWDRQRKEILKRLDKGETYASIARDLGTTRANIWQIAKKAREEL